MSEVKPSQAKPVIILINDTNFRLTQWQRGIGDFITKKGYIEHEFLSVSSCLDIPRLLIRCAVENKKVALIVTDNQLKDMTGSAFIKELRDGLYNDKLSYASAIPAMLITGGYAHATTSDTLACSLNTMNEFCGDGSSSPLERARLRPDLIEDFIESVIVGKVCKGGSEHTY